MTPRTRRYPYLDILRALAATLVFAYHVGYEAGTNAYDRPIGAVTSYFDVGVAIFFAISGFLLYRPFAAVRAGRAPRRPIADYARSRLLRILPAYWVALSLSAAVPGLIVLSSGHWWVFYGLLQAYGPYEPFGLPQAWSLSVEASFYLALPVFAWLIAYVVRTRRWAELQCALLVGLAVAGVLLQTGLDFYAIIGTFDWFAVGMILAIASVVYEDRPRPRPLAVLADRPWISWSLALAAFALTCWWESPGLTGDAEYFVKTGGYTVCATFVLMPAVFAPERALGRAGRAAAWVGTISYGIFLYHLPVLLAVMRLGLQSWIFGHPVIGYTVFGIVGTLPLAAGSWYLIERPALRLRRRRAILAPVGALQPTPIAMGVAGDESVSAPIAGTARVRRGPVQPEQPDLRLPERHGAPP